MRRLPYRCYLSRVELGYPKQLLVWPLVGLPVSWLAKEPRICSPTFALHCTLYLSRSICVWLHITNWCSMLIGMRSNERNIPANQSWKQYVGIDARVTDEGRIDPLAVYWPDGRRFPIDKIVEHGEFGRPLHGVKTTRYSVRFDRRITYLYFERIECRGGSAPPSIVGGSRRGHDLVAARRAGPLGHRIGSCEPAHSREAAGAPRAVSDSGRRAGLHARLRNIENAKTGFLRSRLSALLRAW